MLSYLCCIFACLQLSLNMHSYLALGDSYTIGEQVSTEENFPNQTATLLNNKFNIKVSTPKIIAVTGWTTDELNAAIKTENVQGTFDVVTLLIGVNNQYRGRDIENYKAEFTDLLQQAIRFAKRKPEHVFVLSIPDWGVTPFAEGKDRREIAEKIDEYNAANKAITAEYKCHYLDITASTRKHGTDESFLTPDKLHYSAKEYRNWAEALAPMVAKSLTP
jgi:lysophospholipase L1-like esterase